MKRNRIHILIVDDDATQGKALLEAFKRTGYQATWCNGSVQAITTAQRQEFHCLFVDCMLPKMNGVDLVEEIVKLNPRSMKVFLFSGIYKDKNFIKEASERTNCEAFFSKPLDLEEVLAKIDYAFRDLLESQEEPTLSLYSESSMNDTEVTTFINENSPLHAFHLPMLLKHMQKTHLCGELTLISSQGDMSSMSFYDGQLFAVRTPDKESYFGGLAVGYGFVQPDDVIEALQSPSTKLLGQKLIESFSLSPHAINVILEEQLALRLSQCLRDEVISMQWVDQRFKTPDFALNPARLNGLMDDWIKSKIEPGFIHGMFQTWSRYHIVGKFHPSISDTLPISQLLAHPDFDADRDLPTVFRQLLQREAYIGDLAEDSIRDYSFLESRLDQMITQHKTQNYFQILGVGEKAKTLELNRAFEDFKSHFDPGKLPTHCPPGIVVKCTKVFRSVENAYKTLTDEVARAQYMTIMQNRRSQVLIENEPIFRAAIIELQNGQAKAAARKFQSLIESKMEFKDLRAYRIWAGLKIDRNYRDMTLDQVPPEERHSAPYMMARGIYYFSKGNIQKALESFRTAHVLDPRSNIAQHELKKLAAYIQKHRANNRDLVKEVTSVVENIVTKISRRGA